MSDVVSMGKVQSETGDDNGGEWWGCHCYGGTMSPWMWPSGSPTPTHIKPYIDNACLLGKSKRLQSHSKWQLVMDIYSMMLA